VKHGLCCVWLQDRAPIIGSTLSSTRDFIDENSERLTVFIAGRQRLSTPSQNKNDDAQ
jgi:hypothetical protein